MRRQVMRELDDGFKGLLYVAPERFFAPDFQELIAAAASPSSSPSTKPIASASGATIFGRNIPAWAKSGSSSARRPASH